MPQSQVIQPATRYHVGQDIYIGQQEKPDHWQVRCENASSTGLMFLANPINVPVEIGDKLLVHIDQPNSYSFIEVKAEVIRINKDYPNPHSTIFQNFGIKLTETSNDWLSFIGSLKAPPSSTHL